MTQRRAELPSPPGRGVGGEGAGGEGHCGPLKLPDDVVRGLRATQTDAEALLWSLLRNRRLAGWKFRRQHAIPYVVDFYCDEARLVVEFDGNQHADMVERDGRRTRFLDSRGLQVRRYRNNAVLTDIEPVLQDIWNALHGPSSLTPLPEGEGKSVPARDGT